MEKQTLIVTKKTMVGMVYLQLSKFEICPVNTGDDFVKMREAGHFGAYGISIIPK